MSDEQDDTRFEIIPMEVTVHFERLKATGRVYISGLALRKAYGHVKGRIIEDAAHQALRQVLTDEWIALLLKQVLGGEGT